MCVCVLFLYVAICFFTIVYACGFPVDWATAPMYSLRGYLALSLSLYIYDNIYIYYIYIIYLYIRTGGERERDRGRDTASRRKAGRGGRHHMLPCTDVRGGGAPLCHPTCICRRHCPAQAKLSKQSYAKKDRCAKLSQRSHSCMQRICPWLKIFSRSALLLAQSPQVPCRALHSCAL
jgi:hypothetical protein